MNIVGDVKDMERNSGNKSEHEEKITKLNSIFQEILVDAKELVGDLLSGIYMTFIMGAFCILVGILNIWSNRHYILGGDYLYLLLAIGTAASGVIIILRGFTLRRKYSRLYMLWKKLG